MCVSVGMGKLMLLLCVVWLSLPVWSQTDILGNDWKYGKPSMNELSMETYVPDSSASAVCLFHLGESKFNYSDGFHLVTEHQVRIKVLKPQGVSHADVEIPYYAPDNEDKPNDRISDIEGCSYNLENGKVVKSKLKKSMVSDERVTPYYKVAKFSLPAVREGTVIEYSYRLHSDYYSQIDSWLMQQDIPVVFSRYELSIPEVFVYNIEFRGRNHIGMEEGRGAMRATWHIESGVSRVAKTITLATRELTFTSQGLPALSQDEPFCWCPEDYRIQVGFDLQGTNYPGEGYRPYSKEWDDVGRQLADYKFFGPWLKMNNPFLNEMSQYGSADMSLEEKAVAAFRLLRDRLTWNGEYQLYCDDMEQVLKDGTGSNADLNFILMSLLRTWGVTTYPVVMSTRSRGMLPMFYPSLQKLNTFVVALYDKSRKKYFFMDASMDVPALNVLPQELLVNKARLLFASEAEDKKWINLMELADNQINMQMEAVMDSAGTIRGHRETVLQGQPAVEYQGKRQTGDSLQWWRPSGVAADSRITVSGLKADISGNDYGKVKETFDFVTQAETADGRIYVNPLLFLQVTENPFKQSGRELPVELPYPYRQTVSCLLTLPQGYEVEEMPSPHTVKTEDEKLICKYFIQRTGNVVRLSYTFGMSLYVLPSEYYPTLQKMWNAAVEKNQSVIVLKKKDN